MKAVRELFCADRDTCRGHSDAIPPIWGAAARVAMLDAAARRLGATGSNGSALGGV